MMSCVPLVAHAGILFPEKVTVEYDNNNLYTMRGTYTDGRGYERVDAPLFAVYEGKRQPVFCYEPEVMIPNATTPGYEKNPLPDSIGKNSRAKFISVLWKYAGTDSDTQIVAQSMFWKEVNGLRITSIIKPDGSPMSNQKNIEDKINKIIENYSKKPSFDGQKVKVNLGESIEVEDTNGTNLNSFNRAVSNTANVDWSINGNKLKITPKVDSKETGNLRLVKSQDEGTPVAYKLAGNQSVMAGAIDDPNGTQISLEIVKTGEMKITKIDKKTGKPVPGTKFKVEFGGKSQEVTTDLKGEAIVKDIPHDSKVKATETFVPAPYVLDKNNTKEVVVKAGKTASVEFKNEVATGKTTLTKEDKTTESNEPLNPTYPMVGARYGLFKEDGTLLKEFTLDEKLTATMDNLELGKYFWQETEASVGYTLDPEKYDVELTYKNQNTPVVIKDAKSLDDVIRMNMDGQKVIQNDTNEIFKNGVEFTATNERTQENTVVTTDNVDGKNGYFKLSDMPIDDYLITETKGVEGYENIDPIEVKHSFDKESATFTFTVIDQKSGNVLNEQKITQKELANGKNVDLGTYLLKDKAKVVEVPKVEIGTQAHNGESKDQTFTWGEDMTPYDDVKITHENIPVDTERAFETILVAVTPDEKEKDVWNSGKIDYKVTEKETIQTVKAEYDYKKDPVGTRYYFKEIGYCKDGDNYTKDTEHNFDGKEKTQDLTPIVKPKVEIGTQAHNGESKDQTFTWGEEMTPYDDVKITHENIQVGTERAFETILVAVTPDGKEKDVWNSGKIAYEVTEKDTIQTVKADYDYQKDPVGTRYYFKEIGYNKDGENYIKDTDHNLDGKEKKQDLTPIVPDKLEVEISTKAHTGDGKTQTFTWGEEMTPYDDVTIKHTNIKPGTKRGFETILVAVAPDGKEKDVWTSGIKEYEVAEEETLETVKAEYDYKKNQKGTRYYFKEIGYNKNGDKFIKDTEHNMDGKEKSQDLTPKKENPIQQVAQAVLPTTGDTPSSVLVKVAGWSILIGVAAWKRKDIQRTFCKFRLKNSKSE
ncbi:peptidase [Enterococcus faecalis]|nr:peptidase [Enterococcus faecalis]